MARRLDSDKHADFEKHTDSKKHAEWRKRFGRFSRCGLTVTRFCSAERVSVASFYRWRKHLGPAVPYRSRAVGRRRESGPQRIDKHRRESSPRRRMPDGSGAFRSVTLVSAPPAVVPTSPGVSIHLPCGTRIDVPGEHLDALRTLVAELARGGHDREAGAIHDLNREVASC